MAKGDGPAAANEDTTPVVLSLKQRLAAIRDECANVVKEKIKMGTFEIKAHTMEGVLSEVRPLLAKHGVDIEPCLVERVYSGNLCDVTVDFRFERTDDSDEFRVIRWAGAGTDNADKAFAKAGTNALKEMLKKRFLITDRDDAKEEIESVEHQAEGGASRDALELTKEQRRAAIQQWAATFKMAAEKATTLKEVQRLELDNREQLASEDLPGVTRTFFVELLESRKASFK